MNLYFKSEVAVLMKSAFLPKVSFHHIAGRSTTSLCFKSINKFIVQKVIHSFFEWMLFTLDDNQDKIRQLVAKGRKQQ